MAVALPGMIEMVGICDLGEKRAGILGQGVEKDSISHQANDLIYHKPMISLCAVYGHLKSVDLHIESPPRPHQVEGI